MVRVVESLADKLLARIVPDKVAQAACLWCNKPTPCRYPCCMAGARYTRWQCCYDSLRDVCNCYPKYDC